MAGFVKVAVLGDVAPGQARIVDLNGTAVALFNVGGAIHATDNTCAHRGGPLGEGSLSGPVVTCPWHGFQFDVTTGACRTNPALRVPCRAVRIEGGDILVEG
jgi:nitrite reductase/ring-hydroxylating ferredoxin subunit